MKLLDDFTRRALAETLADWRHELRRAPHSTARLARVPSLALAVARIVFNPLQLVRSGALMRHIGRDVHYAGRRLRNAPAFSVFAVLTLALGIGATTGIYSVVYALVLQPLDIKDIGRVVNIYRQHPPGSGPMMWLSSLDYQDLKSQTDVFSDLTGWARFRQPMSGGGRSEFVVGEMVSGEYFRLLGIGAIVGRVLQPSDDAPSAPPVLVLSDASWKRWFDRDPTIVGKPVMLGGTIFEIVGVAQPTFRGVDMPNVLPTPMWVPLAAMTQLEPSLTSRLNDRDHRWLFVKGRLKPGRTVAEASSQVTAIGQRIDAERGSAKTHARPWFVMPAADMHLHESMDMIAMPLAGTIMGAVALVLLVACTNLANLLLAKGAARRSEIAVRLALGASRWRLVREQLVESALLALAGGVLALIVARALLVLLSGTMHAAPGLTLQIEPRLNNPVLVVAVLATVMALIVFGLVPALRSTRTDLRSVIAADGAGSSVPRWRGRQSLISAQVMVSVILVGLAALCVQQIAAGARHDLGLDVEHLALAQVNFEYSHFDERRARSVMARALEHARGQAGVVDAALASSLPIGMQMPGAYATPFPPPSGGVRAMIVTGTPGMFQTFGVPIVLGRGFDDRDELGAQRVGIVSESLARSLFDTRDAVGRSLFLQSQPTGRRATPPTDVIVIVGIARDTPRETETLPGQHVAQGLLYLPFAQHYESMVAVVARTAGDPAPLVDVLRRAIVSADPEAGVFDAGTGVALSGAQNLVPKIAASISGLLGVLALVLSMAGLYGVLSSVVAGRTREIGVRLALGAEPIRIVRMVLRQGLRPVASGLVAGLAIGVIARVSLRPVFSRIFPALDWQVIAAVPVPFIMAALVACYLPARRAARIDPNVALRDL